jgi:hypothetical protein
MDDEEANSERIVAARLVVVNKQPKAPAVILERKQVPVGGKIPRGLIQSVVEQAFQQLLHPDNAKLLATIRRSRNIRRFALLGPRGLIQMCKKSLPIVRPLLKSPARACVCGLRLWVLAKENGMAIPFEDSSITTPFTIRSTLHANTLYNSLWSGSRQVDGKARPKLTFQPGGDENFVYVPEVE